MLWLNTSVYIIKSYAWGNIFRILNVKWLKWSKSEIYIWVQRVYISAVKLLKQSNVKKVSNVKIVRIKDKGYIS